MPEGEGPVKAWRACGINILRLADDLRNAQASLLGPDEPYLTVEQAALLRGFPDGYPFEGSSRRARLLADPALHRARCGTCPGEGSR